MKDTYLGDGVYASFDGYHIILDTRAQTPKNEIALDPHVFAALCDYAKRIETMKEEGGGNDRFN